MPFVSPEVFAKAEDRRRAGVLDPVVARCHQHFFSPALLGRYLHPDGLDRRRFDANCRAYGIFHGLRSGPAVRDFAAGVRFGQPDRKPGRAFDGEGAWPCADRPHGLWAQRLWHGLGDRFDEGDRADRRDARPGYRPRPQARHAATLRHDLHAVFSDHSGERRSVSPAARWSASGCWDSTPRPTSTTLIGLFSTAMSSRGLPSRSSPAFIIATVGCYFGMTTKGGTQGVGRATTQAVVVSSVFIIIVDLIVTPCDDRHLRQVTRDHARPYQQRRFRRTARPGCWRARRCLRRCLDQLRPEASPRKYLVHASRAERPGSSWDPPAGANLS